MDAKFLLPDGWYVKDEAKSDSSAGCFLSRESIEKDGYFKTGFSVNQNKNVSKKTPHKKAGDFALSFRDGFEEVAKESGKYQIKYEETLLENQYLQAYGVEYVNLDGEFDNRKLGSITIYHLIVGDNLNDTAYNMWFEAPTDKWEESFNKYGKTMLDNFILRASQPDFINIESDATQAANLK